jgi:hypothetical protein
MPPEFDAQTIAQLHLQTQQAPGLFQTTRLNGFNQLALEEQEQQ